MLLASILSSALLAFGCKDRVLIPASSTSSLTAMTTATASANFHEIAYTAHMVTASDGGLIGFVVELYCMEKRPVKVRIIRNRIPVGVVVNSIDNTFRAGVSVIPLSDDLPVNTTTLPSQPFAYEHLVLSRTPHKYFIPIRRVVGNLSQINKGKVCHVSLVMNLTPEWLTSFDSPLPPLGFSSVLLTRRALQEDPHKALHEAYAAEVGKKQ